VISSQSRRSDVESKRSKTSMSNRSMYSRTVVSSVKTPITQITTSQRRDDFSYFKARENNKENINRIKKALNNSEIISNTDMEIDRNDQKC
jgi:CRISPR/Cas system CSM-associated protein Csm2 small subunit